VRRRGKAAALVVDKPLIIALNVAVQAPQEIIVQGRGLDAEMGGDLQVGGTTDSPLVSGKISNLQRGSFSLSGNKLNFTAGQVSFNGAGLKNKIDPPWISRRRARSPTVQLPRCVSPIRRRAAIRIHQQPELSAGRNHARLLFGVPGAQLSRCSWRRPARLGVAERRRRESSLNPWSRFKRAWTRPAYGGAGPPPRRRRELKIRRQHRGRPIHFKRVYIEASRAPPAPASCKPTST